MAPWSVRLDAGAPAARYYRDPAGRLQRALDLDGGAAVVYALRGHPMSPSTSEAGLARTPEPPYYAVIFTSRRTAEGAEEYARTAALMEQLAEGQPGYLGLESARDEGGLGITVSYWQSEEALIAWKRVAEHRAAQVLGRERWYRDYVLRVARVERAYTMAGSAAVGLDVPSGG